MAYASNRIFFLLRCGSDEANGEAWQAGKIKGKYRGISYMEAKTARGRSVPTKRLSEPDCLQARISKYQHTHCRKSAYAHSSVCVFACVCVSVCLCVCVASRARLFVCLCGFECLSRDESSSQCTTCQTLVNTKHFLQMGPFAALLSVPSLPQSTQGSLAPSLPHPSVLTPRS